MVSLGTGLLIWTISEIYWQDYNGWKSFLPVTKSSIAQDGEYWRLFTAALIHADYGHLFSNLYMLTILGFLVFGYFGFLLFPIATLALAAVTNYFSVLTYPSGVRLLGASGWVYVLAGLWLTLYLLIDRRRTIGKRTLRAFGTALVILFPSTFEPQTSYRTHAIGFLVGAGFALFYFVLQKEKIRTFETRQREEEDDWMDAPSPFH